MLSREPVAARGQQRAFGASFGYLRRGEAVVVRGPESRRQMRERMHEHLVLQRKQQQREEGDKGAAHGPAIVADACAARDRPYAALTVQVSFMPHLPEFGRPHCLTMTRS